MSTHKGVDLAPHSVVGLVRQVRDTTGVREEEEPAKLVERLDKASTAYDMEISAKETKLTTNNMIFFFKC